MYSRLGRRIGVAGIIMSLCFGCSVGSAGTGEIGLTTPVGDWGFYNRSTKDSKVSVEVAESVLAGLVDLIKGDNAEEQTVE